MSETVQDWQPITSEEGKILGAAVGELTERLGIDDEGGGPSVEPEPEPESLAEGEQVGEEPTFHEVSDADYRAMVQKQNDLVMFGWAIQNTKGSFYQGTVPARVKRRRRAAGKLARAARKLARPAKRRTGVPRTKHAH
jgi:hypothetical protein